MIAFLSDVCTVTGAIVWGAFLALAVAYASGIVDLRLEKTEDSKSD